MPQFQKLLLKIRSLDKNLRFTELQKVLESYGYTLSAPSGGSHRTFRKSGRPTITIPQDEPIKRAYVELVREIVESEDENETRS